MGICMELRRLWEKFAIIGFSELITSIEFGHKM